MRGLKKIFDGVDMSLSRRSIFSFLAFFAVSFSSFCPVFALDQLGYVTDASNNTVVPVNLTTGSVGSSIPVGAGPLNIAITPDGQKAYVVSVSSTDLTPINLVTNTPLPSLALSAAPSDVVISSDGVMAYVIVGDSNGTVPLVVATDTLQSPIATGIGSYSGCLLPDGSKLFVTNVISNTLTVIDTVTKGVQSISGVPNATDIASSADGAHLYLLTGDSIVEINPVTYTLGATVALGGSEFLRFVLTPDGTKAYVTNQGGNSVLVVDLVSHTVAAEINIGMISWPIDISEDGQFVYVGAFLQDNTSCIIPIETATNTPGTPISLGQSQISGIALVKVSSTPPERPDYFLGQAYRIKKHGHHARYQMKMRWKPSSSENVARYDIYANSEKVTSVSSAEKLFYKKYIHPSRRNRYYIHHDYQQHFKAKWEVRAVSADGSQSSGKHLKVRHDVH